MHIGRQGLNVPYRSPIGKKTNMNRSWLIAVMVLPLLGGCSSENDAPEVVEEQIPISLSNVSGDWAQTRGQLVESLDDFKGLGSGTNAGAFHVEGFKYMSADDTNPVRVFQNQLVSWDKTKSEWTYSKLKFWDIAAEKYRFVGYFPANLSDAESESTSTLSHIGTITNNSLELINLPNWKYISVCDDSKLRVTPEGGGDEVVNPALATDPLCCEKRDGQAMSNFYDVMVASSEGEPGEYLKNDGKVNLHFKHIYAMFVFKVAYPNIDVGGAATTTKYVSDIMIKGNGIPSTSRFKYTYKYDGTSPSDVYDVGTANSDNEYYSSVIGKPVEALKQPHLIVRGLVAPFDLGTSKLLTFYVKYYEAAVGLTGDNKVKPATVITSPEIPVKDLHKVEPGKIYTFTIQFSKGQPLNVIDVSVSDWEDYTSNIEQTFYNW